MIVSGKPDPPAVVLEGFKKLRTGTGLLIVKVTVFDVPPPGDGLITVTAAVPADAISLTVIAAVSCAAEI